MPAAHRRGYLGDHRESLIRHVFSVQSVPKGWTGNAAAHHHWPKISAEELLALGGCEC
jgi:hypothetical protein